MSLNVIKHPVIPYHIIFNFQKSVTFCIKLHKRIYMKKSENYSYFSQTSEWYWAAVTAYHTKNEELLFTNKCFCISITINLVLYS